MTIDHSLHSVAYLDLQIVIERDASGHSRILTDLYRKPTFAPQYLVPWSYHKPCQVRGTLITEALRYLAVCDDVKNFDMHITELLRYMSMRGTSPTPSELTKMSHSIDKRASFLHKMSIRRLSDSPETRADRVHCEQVRLILWYDDAMSRVPHVFRQLCDALFIKHNIKLDMTVGFKNLHPNAFLADYRMNFPVTPHVDVG